MRILGLVPARGGSKGIPGKNIKQLGDKPLLAYTALAARQAPSLTKTILSTDDPAIAEVGRTWGLEVPFMRPADLAHDKAPTLPVILHALAWFQSQGETFDALCLLQPTNPFRTTAEIEKGIALMREEDADTVLSVRAVPKEYHPAWVYLPETNGSLKLANGEDQPIPRRQDLSPAFHRDGSLYLTKTATLLNQHSLYGNKVCGFEPTSPYVNLDTMEDWHRAERLLAQANEQRHA